MPGEAGALLAAAVWALSVVILTGQTHRISATTLNALRTIAAALFVLLLVPFSDAAGEWREMSAATAVAMVGSGLLAMGFGDNLFFVSLSLIGAARTVPIANAISPVLTLIIAALWLDEGVSTMIALGTALIIAGVSLLVQEESAAEAQAGRAVARRATAREWRQALLLLLVASVAWALSTTWLRAGSGNLGPVSAGSLRLTANALVMTALAGRQGGHRETAVWNGRNLTLIAAAGVLLAVGSLFYIFAVQEAGAGKAAVLSSTMPLFSLPMAVVYLHERVTLRVVAGTVLCVVGIWLVA